MSDLPRIVVMEPCVRCDGTGSVEVFGRVSPIVCPDCHGTRLASMSLAELEALLREQRLRSMPRFADQAEAVS